MEMVRLGSPFFGGGALNTTMG